MSQRESLYGLGVSGIKTFLHLSNSDANVLLKEVTIVVADTGKIQAIEAFTPRDATTNPLFLI